MDSTQSKKVWPDVKSFDVYEFSRRLGEALDVEYDPSSVLSRTQNISGSPVVFAHQWLMYNLLRKYPGHKLGVDTRKVAQAEFASCEDKCRLTNEAFSQHGLNGPYGAILHRAAQKIAKVLGPVPSVGELNLRFGPGSLFGQRGNPTVLEKLTTPVQATYGLRGLIPALRDTLPHLDFSKIELVHGSRLSFVPKDAKTDRSICIEPLLNGLVQKGIGTYMKARLRLFGVDLRDQTKNRNLAKEASSGEKKLATVDLKSASDTISFGLVSRLLPMEWVEFLDQARSHRYYDGKQWREFEKFSSMGNAFTFELETLIFWAISGSIAGFRRIAVYGDDIILPCEALDALLGCLSYCGFTANPQKTFGSGPFRESCGGDYYFGFDVTPFRIKNEIRTVRQVYWLANSLRSWADRWESSSSESERLRRLYHWVIGHVLRKHLFGPPGYGDGHLHVPFDVACPSVWKSNHTGKRRTLYPAENLCGWWFYTYVEVAVVEPIDQWPLSYAVYYAGKLDEPVSTGQSRRGAVIRRKSRAFGPCWPEIGNWF